MCWDQGSEGGNPDDGANAPMKSEASLKRAKETQARIKIDIARR